MAQKFLSGILATAQVNITRTGNAQSTTLVLQDNARIMKLGRDAIDVYDVSDGTTDANLYLQGNGGNTTFGGNITTNGLSAAFAGAIKSTRAPGANHGDPTVAFGDGNTGFYERSDNDLRVSIGGSGIWEFSANCLGSVSEGKAHFNNETATATNPSIIPWRNDADTGIGRSSANVLSLIAGGVEALSLTTTAATFAGDAIVSGGDLTVTKQNGSPVVTMLRDGTNPGVNTLLQHLQFTVDYDTAHQEWGGIEHRTTTSATRTKLTGSLQMKKKLQHI